MIFLFPQFQELQMHAVVFLDQSGVLCLVRLQQSINISALFLTFSCRQFGIAEALRCVDQVAAKNGMMGGGEAFLKPVIYWWRLIMTQQVQRCPSPEQFLH